MTAEQFWFDSHVCKQHKRGCCDECMQHVARADAHAAAQLAEKEREIARLQLCTIAEKALAYCTICDDWRGDDSDGATSLRRKAFMELAEAVHAGRKEHELA